MIELLRKAAAALSARTDISVEDAKLAATIDAMVQHMERNVIMFIAPEDMTTIQTLRDKARSEYARGSRDAFTAARISAACSSKRLVDEYVTQTAELHVENDKLRSNNMLLFNENKRLDQRNVMLSAQCRTIEAHVAQATHQAAEVAAELLTLRASFDDLMVELHTKNEADAMKGWPGR